MTILEKLKDLLDKYTLLNNQAIKNSQKEGQEKSKDSPTAEELLSRNTLVETIASDLDKLTSPEDLMKKLNQLQSIKFLAPPKTGFFNNTPAKLPSIDLPIFSSPSSSEKDSELDAVVYNQTLYQLLEKVQIDLLDAFKTRLFNQYKLTAKYDEELIHSSTILVNYMKTSKSKSYSQGSLALDLGRGVKFTDGDHEAVNMKKRIKRLEEKVKRNEKFIEENYQEINTANEELLVLQKKEQEAPFRVKNLKMTLEEAQEIEEAIASTRSSIELNKKQIAIYEEEIKQIKSLISNPEPLILQMAGRDIKKADVLNRFGHQMIEAELMKEFGFKFQIKGYPNLTVTLMHELEKLRTHNIIRKDNDDFYVLVKISFAAILLSNGDYGVLDIDKSMLSFSKDADITKKNSEPFIHLTGLVKLTSDPSLEQEYCMQIKEFSVVCHSPYLVPREGLIPTKCLQIEDHIQSEEAQEFTIKKQL